MHDESCTTECPVMRAMAIIGGKWKIPVLFYLRDGAMRFNELRRALPDVTQKMLTQHLREMEQDGLIIRTVYPQIPPKVEYSVTPLAQKLEPILMALCEWGMEHQQAIGGLPSGLSLAPKDMQVLIESSDRKKTG